VTPADTSPPDPVTGIALSPADPGIIDVAWTDPDPDQLWLDRVVVRMATGNVPPASPTAGTAVYSGTGTAARVSGVTNGVSYSFSLFAFDQAGNHSVAASRTLAATAWTIASSRGDLTYGQAVTVSGRLTRVGSGALTGRRVELYGRQLGVGGFTRLAVGNVPASGTVSFVHHPKWSTEYVLRFIGDGQLMPANSTRQLVQVRPLVRSALSAASIRRGATTRLSGSVAPARPGQAVQLQTYSGGAWRTVATAKLNGAGAYAFTIKGSRRGSFSYRVLRGADSDHIAAASGSLVVRVR
jgi:hypothetical protein